MVCAETEIHIGRIPRSVTELVLYPLFKDLGTIYTFRLMMSSTGENRGYCFVKYATVGEASEAVKQMDGHKIEGKFLKQRFKNLNTN